MSARRNPAVLLSIIYMIFIIYGTTIPFDLTTDQAVISRSIETIRKIPFQRWPGVRESIPDVTSNVLLFIPLGALMCYAGLRARPKQFLGLTLLFAMLTAGLLSLLVEALQILSPTRITSITDLLTNMIGAAIGVIASAVFYYWARTPLKTWCNRSILYSPEMLLLVVYAGLLIASALIPFDISLDVGVVKHGLKSAQLNPLSDPTPWPNMLGNFLWFAGLCFLLCQLLIAHARRLSTLLAVWTGLTLSFILAAGLELSQIFISSRVAATRGVLAGGAGALYGGILFCILNRSFQAGRTSGRKALQGRLIFWLILAHYLVYVAHEALYPYTFRFRSQPGGVIRGTLLPFAAYYGKTRFLALFDFLGGIARFSPLGFLLQRQRRPSRKSQTWPSVVLCLGLGFLLEGLQLWVAGRYADISDVIAAGCGGYVGVLVWRWWQAGDRGEMEGLGDSH